MTSSNDLITHHFAEVGEVMLHYVTAGSGPPIVLLHGWPQTWYEWRHIIPRLAERFTVIAPDLRGLGDSSRPLSGYDKKTVSGDVWRLVSEQLGHETFHLVGHDWGGPTAFALAAAHPESIRTLTIVDVVIPGDGGDFSEGGRRWHHQFHITPDLPEALITGRERTYLQWFYQTFSYKSDAIDDDALNEFVRTYSQRGALRAGFNFYRSIGQDAADNAALLKTGFKLPMPVLAIGGGVSYPHGRGRGTSVEESLRRVANNVRGEVIPECGHFVPEEQPEKLTALLLDFLNTSGP
ncbi:MAG: alpha/beta hydrolase [Hyphomicrobiaceae bacterium TMED74]|nr:alpha/beta hydrolase [Filomicrobium sp.]RPG39104.1 MAG: alpha/beta hydrolase [Hyphomicrobiaceae bacterium TMED74]